MNQAELLNYAQQCLILVLRLSLVPIIVATVIGIIVGIVGGIIASLAYPIYNSILKAKRQALAPEIIRLTDELMK